jgi:hypothetical protein
MRILLILVVLCLVPASYAIEADFYLMDISPQKVVPGENTTLNITLKNLAPALASYVKASLDPEDVAPIDPLGAGKYFLTKKAVKASGDEKYFGAVWQYEELYLSIPIYTKSGTAEGVYNVPLVVEWKNEKLEDKSQTLYVNLLVQGEIDIGLTSFSTEPSKIRSGDEDIKVTFTFENTGEAAAQNIEIRLLLAPPFSTTYSHGDRAYIGSLGPGEAQSVTFYIDIDENVKPGKYSIPFEITYKDKRNDRYAKKDSVEVIIEPKPYFEISSTNLKPSTLKPGDHSLLYINLKNIGFEKAEAVDVRVVRETGQPFRYDVRSDFIGTLKPNETGTAVLEFDVEKDAIPKEYLLRIIVRCTGDTEKGDTNVYTQELKVPLLVNEGSSENISLKYLAVIVVLLAGLIAWLKLRKPKETEE